MSETAGNRKARRNRQVRGSMKTRAKSLASAAALATALTVGMAATSTPLPAANADLNIPVVVQDPLFTTGLLAGVIAGLGLDNLTIPVNLNIENVPVIGTITIGDLQFVLDNVARGPASIYNAINGWNGWSTSGNTRYRFPASLGIGNGAYDLVNAYRAQLASVAGNTPQGYTPFVPGPNGQTNFTSQALLLVQNPYRPNGGILPRFGPLLNLFGVDTTVPPAGQVTDTSGKIALNTATLDLAWAYDPLSDFPETLNPFSLLNSAFATLPTNLLGGVNLDSNFNATDAGLNIAGVLGLLNKYSGIPTTLLPIPAGEAWYATLIPNDLPLLEPLRLPVRAINAVAGALGLPLNLGTPLADALQPALSILVNTGYTDIQTPTQGGTYNRTFADPATTIPFLSQAPLTPAEWAQVPGDVFRALVVGFQDTFPILRFGNTAPTLVVDGNHLKIVYPPAGSGATTPTATATVGTPTTTTAKSVVSEPPSTPTTDPVTVTTTSPTTSSVRSTAKKKPSVTAPAATAQDSSSHDTTATHKDSSSSQKDSSTGHSKASRAAS